jgi:very-short-patch-repair endonuclease
MDEPFLGSASPYTRQELRAKQFVRLTRDVYVRSPQSLDLPLRCRGVRLAFPDAVLCGRTAALLHGLPVADDGRIHITRGMLEPRSERALVRTHRLDVAEDELEIRGSLVLTVAPRTWTDLASTSDIESLVAVGDVVLRRYGAAALAQAVERSWGRPGVSWMREALPLLDGRAESPAESRMRVRLHKAGYVGLQPQQVIRDAHGGWIACADLGDPVARIAVQHDGAGHFERGRRQWEHDVQRDELSRREGWQVVVSTARDDASPQLLLEKVRAAYWRAAQVRGGRVLPPFMRAA